MKIRFTTAISLLLVLLTLAGCKAKTPEGIPSERQMENILYDYQLAQALAGARSDSVAYYERYYVGLVLEKYGMTAQQFDEAVAYYSGHAEVLGKIYNRINERLAEASPGTGQTENAYAKMLNASGDTLNLWHERDTYVLSATGQNRMEFSIPVDTAVQAGDRLLFEFTPRWLYREGQKEAIICLALHYKGDSVAVVTNSIYSSARQGVTLHVDDKPLERITGFVYQQANWSSSPKLLIITAPILARFRTQRSKPTALPTDSAPADSTATDSTATSDSLSHKLIQRTASQRIRDSLLQQEKQRRPHFK